MASISRSFLVRFGDFEFPAALAHFYGGNEVKIIDFP